jgi:putative DNA primase/helicase
LDDWADEIIQELDSYTEVTPSQKGVRVWTEGRLSPWRNPKDGFGVHKKGGLEVYSRNRFFTVTGNHVAGTPRNINHRQAAI